MPEEIHYLTIISRKMGATMLANMAVDAGFMTSSQAMEIINKLDAILDEVTKQ